MQDFSDQLSKAADVLKANRWKIVGGVAALIVALWLFTM